MTGLEVENRWWEVLAHEGNVGEVGEVVDKVCLVALEFSSSILGGVAIKLFNVEFGDLGSLSSRKSSLLLRRWRRLLE
jgi:hypothetical protein